MTLEMESIEELIKRINRNTAAQIEQSARMERWAVEMGLAPLKTQQREPTELELLLQKWKQRAAARRRCRSPFAVGNEPDWVSSFTYGVRCVGAPMTLEMESIEELIKRINRNTAFAPGHPVGLPGPPCAGPRAQESAALAAALPLVPCSALPDHPDVAGLLPDVAVAPRLLLRFPWVIGHHCAVSQGKTSVHCCILKCPGLRSGRPCRTVGSPRRRGAVLTWLGQDVDRSTLKSAHGVGRKRTFMDSRVGGCVLGEEVAVAPLLLLRLPWVIGEHCAGSQGKTSVHCCILKCPGLHSGRPCRTVGSPRRRGAVLTWLGRDVDRSTLKSARGEGRKRTYMDSRVGGCVLGEEVALEWPLVLHTWGGGCVRQRVV
ncbi:UNVERIFIED_CONTAM: hypothetical protein FKN15_006603 [Acipenser sinensis]